MNLSFLKKVAPWIGAAAEGNIPALIGMAAQTVSGALGKKIDATPEAISDAVAGATPAQLLQLKQIDDDFALKMQAAGFANVEDMAQIAEADRDSARKREMTVRDRMPMVLSLAAIVVLVTCLGLLKFGSMPTSTEGALLVLIGTVSAAFKDVYGYYFGSSSSADANAQAVATIAKK